MYTQSRAPESRVFALHRLQWTTGGISYVIWQEPFCESAISLPFPASHRADSMLHKFVHTLAGDYRLDRAWSENCRPPSGPEVQGTATNAELWGLLESDSGVPPLTGTEVKIVWRMTGSGNFTIVAVGPYGMKLPPSQGPDEHPASSWSRPGDEWGTVFTFPMAGCWDLHATRDNAFGDVWLEIVDWYL